jgi:lipoprotein NlpI
LSPLIFSTRGKAYAALGKWQQAADDLSLVIKLTKERGVKGGKDGEDVIVAAALLERAKVYDHLGKTELAAKDRAAHKAMSKSVETDFFGK